MITNVVLGDGSILNNISEVQEVIQNNGNHILNGLTLNITKDETGSIPTISEVESIFNQTGILNNIKVYKKDLLKTEWDETTKEIIEAYGEEYLALDTVRYTGIQSIYKHFDGDRISVQLTADPMSIADDKYNELIAKNEKLEQTILELTILLGGAVN